MSVDGTKLLFEGFLQKRKDTVKIRWVTYWFRLQNTTLFFYTKKNGSASHLRGHYYIYTVQSVREVQRFESRRFMFEIIMANGKRKVLAAETAALRKEWVGCLWQAMNLSASVVSDSRSTQPDMCERLNSNTPFCSHTDTDSVMESLPALPLFAVEGHIHQEIRSIAPSICLSEEPDHEEAMQSTPPACSYQHHNSDSPPWSSGLSNAGGGQEGDYDILPLKNKVCEISASTDVDESVYDFPLAYRRAVEHHNPTESIYDVPSSLMRRMADHPLEEQSEDRICWMI